jgi:anti-anti-sigma factor
VFSVISIPQDTTTRVLTVQGAVDLSNVREFEGVFQDLFAKGIYRIVLDLERVTFISSAGFGCLLHARDVVLKQGGGLVIAGTNPKVREIFDVLGITSILRFAPDVGGALAQLERQPTPSC